MKRLALLALAALLAGGCGGAKEATDASELVPPSALAFVSLETDLGGIPRVLDRFPFGPSALRDVRRALHPRRTMGPRLELALFKAGSVSFVRPPDEKRFVATLGPKQLHARIRGWTVFTEKPGLLDLVRRHEGRLSELRAFRRAMKGLPADATVRAYAAPSATGMLVRSLGAPLPMPRRPGGWTGAALNASGGELRLDLRTPAPAGVAAESASDLVSQIPSSSVLAVGLDGLAGVPGDLKVVGIDVREIANALGEQALVYVRAGLPFPEVTFASKPKDPQRALRNVARLVEKLARPKAPPVPTTVDGVTLQDVQLGAIDIYYGTFDGRLVVSDSPDAVEALRGHGDKLNVPGLPDRTNGFLYVDVERALPALQAFAKLANQTLPRQLDDYAKPLKTIVLYGTREGDVQSLVAVLQTR